MAPAPHVSKVNLFVARKSPGRSSASWLANIQIRPPTPQACSPSIDHDAFAVDAFTKDALTPSSQ
jgi:hypothetical protein